jgi:hypothetical protein
MLEAQSEATTSLEVPTIDEVVAKAYRRAGLLNVQQSPSIVQSAAARSTLNDMVDHLAAGGVLMRAVQVGYVTLVTGQNLYTMPENVFDIVGNGAYIDPTQSQVPFQAASETPVVMKDRDTWQNLTAKSAQSRPYIGYFAREAPTSTLYLWPTPSATENTGKIRFNLHVTRPDVINGSNTLPFERYWTEYFVWGLAVRLAFDNSMPDVAGALTPYAAAALQQAKGYSKQNVSVRAKLDHSAGWGNRSWRR